jgi:hypothetical protein
VQLARATKESGLIPPAHAKAAAGIEEGLSRAPLSPPRSAQWEEAWRVTEALIAKTGQHAEKHGARFMLFTVPYAIQVHPDPAARAAVQQKLGVEDLFYPDRRLAQLGEKHRLRVLPLAPLMQPLAEKERRHFHGFPNTGLGQGHWNAQGHRAAAQLIARHLCEGG